MKLFTYVLCVAAAVSAFAVQAYTARRQPPLPLGTPIASLAPTGAGAAAAEAPARSTDARGKAVRAAGIAPTPDDAPVARTVAMILQQYHYGRHRFDDEISGKFLNRYLDNLDPLHIYFLEGDTQEFEKWRTQLDDLTLRAGDVRPGYEIFSRWLKRVEQESAYVAELLKNEKFTFEGNEEFLLERKDQPRPKDLESARKLWRDRLRYEYLQEKLGKQQPAEIVKTLSRRHERFLKTFQQYDGEDILQIYLTSLAHVYDPHSDYLSGSLYDDFDISMKLSLFGIGALLSSEDGYCKIVELTPGGPALLSGKLKPGDRIVGVAQGDTEFVDVIEMKLNKIVEMIRGAKGTTVRLKVIPAGSPDTSTTKVVSLVRAEVKLEEQEAKAKVFDTTGTDGKRQRLGVIELPSFYESPAQPGRPGKSATEDVRRLIGKLKTEGCEGLVLDLRRNGGGSLQEAIRLSGLFIRKGPVVQVRSSDGRESEDDDPDAGIAYDGPLVVLTSRMSASASEILAGCLQDYDRAVVVGDVSTHGKGTVQTLLGLQELMERSGIRLKRNPGAIKVTIQKFYRPSGASTQLEGVKPDIILPSLSTHLDIGEKALDNPLAWDTIPSSQFEKFHLIQSRLPELRKRSEARVGADPDFRWVREEAERLQKLRARKSVSLNEAQRLQEKKEIAERQAARVTDLKNRPETKDVVRPLALKQVDTPGLPAPVKDVPKAPRPRPGSPAPDEDDAEAAQVNAPDFTLNEARRILLDLVSLSRP